MERVIYIVQWDHVNNQSLMYGSVVTQDIDRSIFYQNQMLAPGSIVHTWKDAYNYQAVRQERSLPLLSGGSRYSIRIPENASLDGVILRFEFIKRVWGILFLEIKRALFVQKSIPVTLHS